ncbi:MAG: type II toxin-antitoxin system Phd/YefM family antitoxin [Chloroflexi bacterium]|nr:type II toxin-antitoxin system Phd/YefM family antitoxin [Chloroflexota bacterium]
MQKILPVSKVQPQLYALVKEVNEGGEPVIVTRRSGDAAVLLSREEYESLLATIEVLSMPHIFERLREAEENYAAGRTMTLAQLKRRLHSKRALKGQRA